MTATSRTSTTRPIDARATEPEALRAQIDDTRQALGDIVDALAAKAGIKTRFSAKITEGKDRLRMQPARLGHGLRQHPASLAGAVTALLVGARQLPDLAPTPPIALDVGVRWRTPSR